MRSTATRLSGWNIPGPILPQHALQFARLGPDRLPAREARLLEGADRGHVALDGARDARAHARLREDHIVDEPLDDIRPEAAMEQRLLADEKVHCGHPIAASERRGIVRKIAHRIRLDVARVLAV